MAKCKNDIPLVFIEFRFAFYALVIMRYEKIANDSKKYQTK